jgi:hypothetical protein
LQSLLCKRIVAAELAPQKIVVSDLTLRKSIHTERGGVTTNFLQITQLIE